MALEEPHVFFGIRLALKSVNPIPRMRHRDDRAFHECCEGDIQFAAGHFIGHCDGRWWRWLSCQPQLGALKAAELSSPLSVDDAHSKNRMNTHPIEIAAIRAAFPDPVPNDRQNGSRHKNEDAENPVLFLHCYSIANAIETMTTEPK